MSSKKKQKIEKENKKSLEKIKHKKLKQNNTSNFLNNKSKRTKNYSNEKNNTIIGLNPAEITFLKDLGCNAFSIGTNNTFTIFNSINDILYLIYTNDKKTIISYNMIDNKIINEIKNAHFFDIINFRHYLDKITIKDLLLSSDINNLKIWNIINFECIIKINNINIDGFLFSACFLYNNTIFSNIIIITFLFL